MSSRWNLWKWPVKITVKEYSADRWASSKDFAKVNSFSRLTMWRGIPGQLPTMSLLDHSHYHYHHHNHLHTNNHSIITTMYNNINGGRWSIWLDCISPKARIRTLAALPRPAAIASLLCAPAAAWHGVKGSDRKVEVLGAPEINWNRAQTKQVQRKKAAKHKHAWPLMRCGSSQLVSSKGRLMT